MATTSSAKTMLIDGKTYPSRIEGRYTEIQLPDETWLRLPNLESIQRYSGAASTPKAWTEIVRGFRAFNDNEETIGSLQNRWKKYPEVKKGEQQITAQDGIPHHRTPLEQKLKPVAEKILKTKFKKKYDTTKVKVQPKDFEGWFGSKIYADDDTIDSLLEVASDPKEIKKLEIEKKKNERVPVAVENWKKEWLWRTNKAGKPIVEREKSPTVLWSVMARLKKGESFPKSLADYYKKNTGDDITEKLLREGKYSKDQETGEPIPHPKKLSLIKADLKQLMLNDIKKGTAEESPSKWYTKAKAVRGFLQANAISVPDQEPSSPLAQSVTDWSGQHSTIKLQPLELEIYLSEISKYKEQITIKEPARFSITIGIDSPDKKKELEDNKIEFQRKYNRNKEFPHKRLEPFDKWTKDSMITEEVFNEVKNLTLTDLSEKFQEGTNYPYDYISIPFNMNKQYCTKAEDWYDAELLVRLCLELGTRAQEAFTLNAFPSRAGEAVETGKGFKQTSDYDTDAESGMLWQEGLGKMQCTIITWKTHQMGEMGLISVQHILNKKTNEMFRERQQKILEEFGFDKNPKQIHSFIGKDDKYITADKMMLRNTKPTPAQDKNREILNAIIRYNFQAIGKDWSNESQAYFFEHPVHAWRHIMAQHYTYQTNQDYDWIAIRGHWNTLTVLRESYASLGFEVQKKKDILYGDLSMKEVAAELTEKQKQIAKSSEWDAQYKTWIIQQLNNPQYRKDSPVEAYHDLIKLQQLHPDYLQRKSVSDKIRKFMDEFKHGKMEVAIYNDNYAEEIEKKEIPKVTFVPRPEEEPEPNGDDNNDIQ